MKRFLFSLAIIMAAVLSTKAQGLCEPYCYLTKNIMLSECAKVAYPQIALEYYDYFTDGQDFPVPHEGNLGMSKCEYEAESWYRGCMLECTGYYPED